MHAIIDLGTNTFHLLIATIEHNQVIEHRKLQIPVKLGQGGINKGYILDAAFDRGMKALAEFRKVLDDYGVQEIRAFATSAIRSARNGTDFIERAKRDYNITVQVISGDEEALFIYEGVKHAFDLPAENVLMMDIGGGSVEFVIAERDNIKWKKSFLLGAARLIEKYHKADPIQPEDINRLMEYLQAELEPLTAAMKAHPCTILVGSAGSFETLVSVLRDDLEKMPVLLGQHAFEICPSDFEKFYELMITLDREERTALKGMSDFRVEMITVAAILMKFVISFYPIKRLIASDYALKEGMLFSVSEG